MRVLLAVDGGNSKTDLALVGEDGGLLAFARGPQSSPHHLGEDGCMRVLEGLVEEAGLNGRVASMATLCMAGVDFPREEERLAKLVDARGWTRRTTVLNDTFAVLRAGTEDGWGVAVVCGAGINCVGVAPDGRQVRFPALGAITGDWGGGFDVGLTRRLEGGAQLRRPRPEDDTRARGAHALWLRDAVRTRRGDPPQGDRGAAGAGAVSDRLRRGRARRGRRRDRRSARRRGGRAGVDGALPTRPGDASGRGSARRWAAQRSEFARGRAHPRRSARAVAGRERPGDVGRRRSSGRRCSRSTRPARAGRRRSASGPR